MVLSDKKIFRKELNVTLTTLGLCFRLPICYVSLLLKFMALATVWPIMDANAKGNILEILVRPDSSNLQPGEVRCPATTGVRCTTGLSEAIELIQRPEWQRQLNRKFSEVRLRLAPGTYSFVAPLNLHWGVGLTAGIQLRIAGDGTESVISGAMPVTHWSAVTGDEALMRITTVAKGHVRVADISKFSLPLSVSAPPHGFGLPIRPTLTEVFYRNKPQLLAGWPNAGYGHIVRSADLPASDKKTFGIEDRFVGEGENELDLQISGYWFYDWAAQTYRIANQDHVSNVMTLEGSGSTFGIKNGQRLRLENALTELDMPGEWYVDRIDAKVYFWPPGALGDTDVEISVGATLLKIVSSQNVTVSNMSFEKTRGDAITVTNSHNVIFDNVVIHQTGNRALVIEGGAWCGVHNSLIEDTGEGAVSITGGNRQTLEPAGHFVSNNTIRRFSRLVKTYRPAVNLAGVGNLIKGNIISDAPHIAIQFAGNDHEIVGNEIFNVVNETGDAGAIYTGRDYTARGTVIEENYLHDIQPDNVKREVKGIYLDDQASGVAVRSNIFARVQQPVFIGGGRDNVIEKNVFYDSSPAIYLDARGITWQRDATLDPKRELQTRLNAIPYKGELYSQRYPHLAEIQEDEVGAPKYNIARDNVVVKGKPYLVTKDAEMGIELDEMAEQSEGVFVRPAPVNGRRFREDFRLQSKNLD